VRPFLSGLRPKLFALIILPFTVVLLGISIAGIEIHQGTMRRIVAERDERSVHAAAAAVSEELFHRLLTVRDVAFRLKDGVTPIRAIAEEDADTSDFPQGLAAVSPDARIIAGKLPKEIVGSRTLMDALAARDMEAFLRPVRQENETMLLAVMPGKPASIVGAFYLSDLMRTALPGFEASPVSATVVIVDSILGLLAHLGAPPQERDYRNHPGVREALRGLSGSSFLTPQGEEEHVLAFSPIRPVGWALMIEEPWQSVASPMFRLSLVAPLALAPILVISLLGLWLSASQVVAPLRDLQGRAIKLAAGDFHAVETEIGGVQEIRDLQRSMVTMARRIQSAQQSLRRYIGKVTSIQEEERRRIARDLHDETIQDFIALDQKVQLLGRNPRGGKGRKSDSVETIHREAREAIQRVRRLSLALRPGYLEDLGLVPALEALANDVSSKAGIPISFHVTGTAAHQSSSVDLAIYRIVQESLSNVVRHAQAHHAWVDLRFAGEEVRLIVRDDGAGFVPPREAGDLTQAGHFGLVGMRERAQFIGGSLEVHSTPGKGTRLILRLPLQS